MIISSMLPVVPKKTRGASDFLFIPTGIASSVPASEKNQVPGAALHISTEIQGKQAVQKIL
jgi:hypothetical protein